MDVLQGGGAGSTSFRVRYVGDDPPHGMCHLEVLKKGSYMDHWGVSPAVSGRKLVVPNFIDGDVGGRF